MKVFLSLNQIDILCTLLKSELDKFPKDASDVYRAQEIQTILDKLQAAKD